MNSTGGGARKGLEEYEVDGLSPKIVSFPDSVEKVSAAVRSAAEAGWAIGTRGGGTMTFLGGIPARMDMVLCMQRMNRILKYEPDDLTVSAEAGMTLSDLSRSLARRNQHVPIESPFPERATIGGVIAANASGPRRGFHDGVRDYLIGMSYVNSDGKVIKTGGMVVKNVAGYDLKKLFTGSLGTLGVIVRANFKVVPIPETRRSLVLAYRSIAQLWKNFSELPRRGLGPSSSVILNMRSVSALGARIIEAFGESPYLLAMEFSGWSDDVDEQLSEVEASIRDGLESRMEISQGQENDAFWRRVIESPYEGGGYPILCRASMMRSKTPEFLGACERLSERLRSRSDARVLMVHCYPSSGVVRAGISDGAADRAVPLIEELRDSAHAVGGYLVIEKAPSEVKMRVPVWGPVGEDFPLIKGIKSAFDPKGIFNPGRFVGGL